MTFASRPPFSFLGVHLNVNVFTFHFLFSPPVSGLLLLFGTEYTPLSSRFLSFPLLFFHSPCTLHHPMLRIPTTAKALSLSVVDCFSGSIQNPLSATVPADVVVYIPFHGARLHLKKQWPNSDQRQSSSTFLTCRPRRVIDACGRTLSRSIHPSILSSNLA